MNNSSLPKLLGLGNQNPLQDEALAIMTLESLPVDFFPRMFMAAIKGRHWETLKVVVQAWPFHCLPLGVLMEDQQPDQDILKAMLDGIDSLLAQKNRPKAWKLKVLDLRTNTSTNLRTVGSGPQASSGFSLSESELAQIRSKGTEEENSRPEDKQVWAPVDVLIDLCFKDANLDQCLTFLIEKVKQSNGLLQLCCKKIEFLVMSSSVVTLEEILNWVQLGSVEEVRVHCVWSLFHLAWFTPYLAHMVHLNRLHLSKMALDTWPLEAGKKVVSQFAYQTQNLNQLLHLHLDSIHALYRYLDPLLSGIKMPLETLRITNCFLSESNLTYLSLCPSTRGLKLLDFQKVNLTSIKPDILQALLERASATLQHLDLGGCGIIASQLKAIIPVLGRCSQLIYFSLYASYVSKAVLKSLLHHTIPPCKFRHLQFPVPLECYVGKSCTFSPKITNKYLLELRLILQGLGHQPDDINISSSTGYYSIVMRFKD